MDKRPVDLTTLAAGIDPSLMETDDDEVAFLSEALDIRPESMAFEIVTLKRRLAKLEAELWKLKNPEARK